MTNHAKFLSAPLVLSLASCVANDGQVNVRPIANPLAAAQQRGSPMLHEGRGLLALGNVGLALEAFRKALRDEPGSKVQALAGIAESYERMGRHDLARANYEAALALEPGNIVLLNTFAASLERQGLRAEATAVRAEATRRDSAAVAAAADEIARTAAAEAVRQSAPAAASKPGPVAQPIRHAPVASLPSVTVSLPPVRPAAPAAQPIPSSSVTSRTADVQPPRLEPTGPRLERVSLAEVALVTAANPLWRPQVIAQTQHSVTVRFVPLRPAYRDTRVRLLNAARHQGLAARTRIALSRKGWGRVAIGDAGRVRERTLILYSPATAEAARRLSTEFGFGIARDPRSGPLTVLLGRDVVRRAQAKS